MSYLDKAGATWLISKIKLLLSNKVDVVEGKGLSANDYTAEEKAKLEGIDVGANKYTLPVAGESLGGVKSGGDVSVDSTGAMTVDGLGAKAPINSPTFTGSPKAPTPTKGNNSTQIATTAFVTTAVGEAVADITSIKFEVVAALPSVGEPGTIYLVANDGSVPNIYDEYICLSSANETAILWEKIGTTDVDLSGYLKKTDMVAITNAEIDAMFS